MYGLSGRDLIEIAQLPNLKRLGAQQAMITEESLLALLRNPSINHIDFECSNFDDRFADIVAESQTIAALELGATGLTRDGLVRICSMPQLKELDIWATNISEADLDVLQECPSLEWLSMGGHDEQTTFTVDGTLPRLRKIRSLKKVWLDGFRVTREQWNHLNDIFEEVRVSTVVDGE